MNRESAPSIALVLGCLAALILVLFYPVLFLDEQFAYRDAAHFYYPLYQRVQQEWDAGRWPLWEPEENSGMPLMGNPTAAVLYPGKMIYAVLSYAWAARVYIIAHVVLAFAAMLALMRHWGVGWIGAGLSATSYTFCGPVLFQYCNIIYLVGAAWLPLGFLAVDRWVRTGSRLSLVGLAVVLAMQTLGGDPQASYLLGLCALAYSAGTAWTSGRGLRSEPSTTPVPKRRRGWALPALLAVAAIWLMLTFAIASLAPSLRPHNIPPSPTPALSWMLWVPKVVPVVWAAGLLIYFARKKPTPARSSLWKLACGLGLAAGLAGSIAAAQLLPVVEFTQRTVRAAEEGPHEIYPFSVEPFRVVEMFWPRVFGSYFRGNASWIDLIQLSDQRGKVWTPSLYVGAAIFLLASLAPAFRRGTPERVWLTWVVAITLLGSFGQYTSPIWATRLAARTMHLGVTPLGPLDQPNDPPIRKDGFLRDGDGGLYWGMTTFLPAFRQFRFPSKLMTFSVLGIAALAGMGWDDLVARRASARAFRWRAVVLLAMSLLAIGGFLAGKGTLYRAFDSAHLASAFGRFEPDAAFRETITGLAQAALVATAALGVVAMAARRPRLAGAAALALVSADMAFASRGMVATAPQRLFEGEPEVMEIIRKAEEARPADGPYRIHRSPIWNPISWPQRLTDNPARQFMEWERATIQPKYGITMGVDFTHTIGVAELYDYEWFFGGFPFRPRREFGESLTPPLPPGKQVVYFPRRSYDMWNTRYFILPAFTNDWMDENRGFAAFLDATDIVYPPIDRFGAGTGSSDEARAYFEEKDFQVRRNRNQYPRAWAVHDKIDLRAITGMTRAERAGPMMEIMYDDNDPIWVDPTRASRDPRQVAWVEAEDALALIPYARGPRGAHGDKVEVAYPEPGRVEIKATLDSPGIVVLADVFYPGWKLTIDDKPAPVYRVNRMMRGAAVESGTHKLIYTYDPGSFRVGLAVSATGLAAACGLALAAWRRPRTPLPWNA